MPILYRRARGSDLLMTTKINRRAYNELQKLRGFPKAPSKVTAPSKYHSFFFGDEPRSFWVAEDRGKLVGFTHSWHRGNLWFLSYLFISPEYQGRGVGRNLLERTMSTNARAEGVNRCTITFSYNPSSVSLYARYGMIPRLPLYEFTKKSSGFKDRQKASIRGTRLKDKGDLRTLGAVDEEVLGFRRDSHHRFWLNGEGTSCLLFQDGSARAYGYISGGGAIGPVAATTPSLFEGALASCMSKAVEIGTEVSMFVAGTNTTALDFAFRHGMKLGFPMVLMSGEPFGQLDRYVFHSPMLI